MKLSPKTIVLAALAAGALLTAANSRPLLAQADPRNGEAPIVDASKANAALAQQIREMQAKAARLQGALAQNTSPAAKKPPMGQMPVPSPAAGMSPGGMSPGGGMEWIRWRKAKWAARPWELQALHL